MTEVLLKKLNENAVIPKYAHEGEGVDAGFDFVAVESGFIIAGEWIAVGTGLAVEIPAGYEIQVRPRSGLALKQGVSVLNTPGTIDSSYRGEIKVILVNHSKDTFFYNAGDRIAQGVLARVSSALFIEVEELSDTARGAGGFGSTGK